MRLRLRLGTSSSLTLTVVLLVLYPLIRLFHFDPRGEQLLAPVVVVALAGFAYMIFQAREVAIRSGGDTGGAARDMLYSSFPLGGLVGFLVFALVFYFFVDKPVAPGFGLSWFGWLTGFLTPIELWTLVVGGLSVGIDLALFSELSTKAVAAERNELDTKR